jgi:outer membrane protein TolC
MTKDLMLVRAVAAASLLSLGWSPPALALQPLDLFVQAARSHNPGNREAEANRAQAEAQAGEVLGRALPGFSAVGSYTRNQREVAFGGTVVVPRDQWDATLALSVPLVDLAQFARVSAAHRAAEAATHRQEAIALETEAQVVQSYYQVAANLALAEAARKALEAVRLNLQISRQALDAGTATTLDVERASAEVERQTQQVTGAELQVALAARALESQTAVTAEVGSGPALTDDLHPERPLAELAGSVTPALRAARSIRAAAERSATAQRLTLLPSLSAAASERFTNATGFLGGYDNVYAATLSLGWAIDLGTAPAIRARAAEADAARAREEATRLAAGDAIHRAWSTIAADLARSRSARAQATVSAHAADIARARYRSGVATQLDLIQADRDAFAAEAARIQADADLANARLQLVLATGTPLDLDRSRGSAR